MPYLNQVNTSYRIYQDVCFHLFFNFSLMKATLTTTFNENQLKEILNSHTIPDCKRAAGISAKRIQLAEEQKQHKKGGIRKMGR